MDYNFYSKLCNGWLKIIMTYNGDSLITITMTDITDTKNKEEQLQAQNEKLESLAKELQQSRSDLRAKLSSIQTLNEQLHFAAYHDSMTNLYNRAYFTKMMADEIVQADIHSTGIGLLMLDIDNLKDINDSQGHNRGDEVLRQTAVALRTVEDSFTTSFRFGGDEFLIVKTNINDRKEMEKLGNDVLRECNKRGIHVSGGISVYPSDSKFPQELLSFADMAKTEVKRNGKNNVFFFHLVMQEKFLGKLNLESKLIQALKENVFQLYFQPQFDVSSGKLRGFEALLRWHDNELGWISPDQFIPLAEESRLVIPLGDWVMETGIATLASWEKKFNFNGIISINVSPVQFNKADFLEKLEEKIARHKVQNCHLEMEVTEGMLIDNVDETIGKLQRLRDMGIGVSLDDFGTGYSSLRYLQILPLTTLKIDKSFISNISQKDGVEANITQSIVSMVSKMGLDTIAEGVETEPQLDMLRQINCHNVQGFLKGKPMPIELCERMLSGDTNALLTIKNSN